jgi:hypothetical protein
MVDMPLHPCSYQQTASTSLTLFPLSFDFESRCLSTKMRKHFTRGCPVVQPLIRHSSTTATNHRLTKHTRFLRQDHHEP